MRQIYYPRSSQLKRSLRSALVVIILTAAILPATAQGSASEQPQLTANWQGFYLGAFGGMTHLSAEQIFSQRAPVAGVIGGYNHQFDRLVLGAEAMFGTGGGRLVQRNAAGSAPGLSVLAIQRFSSDWNGRLRLRLGWATGNMLMFLTTGLVVDRQRYLSTVEITPSGFAPTSTILGAHTGSKAGLTVGAGMEYALSDRWRLRFDYVYDLFGDRHYTGPVSVRGGTIAVSISSTPQDQGSSAHTAQMSLTYRF